MKILIVNTFDIEGGAARAAYRLHRSLLEKSMDSLLLVQHKLSDDFTIIGPTAKLQKMGSKLRPLLDTLPGRRYKQRSKTLFSPSWVPFSGVVDRINALQPDIVHLHWINGGMMSVADIARINAPIIWSLHDMWPFTGGCHYDELCGAFKQSCGSCRVLGSSTTNDLSKQILHRKKKTFASKKDITLVGLSRWIAKEAASSSLFSDAQVVNLPNPIDTQDFAPFDRCSARKLLNLPQDKKLVLFGAMGATSDPRKGFTELSEALMHLQTQNVELIVLGSSQPEKAIGLRHKAHYLGRVHDDVTLRVLYNAADVTVVPSLQENLSNAIMESLACGTPVVSFDVGGSPDLIDHKVNGYLAQTFITQDLSQGIDWILQNEEPDRLASNARQKVLAIFDSKVVAGKYINLYRNILNDQR